jgi:hypothetical protein
VADLRRRPCRACSRRDFARARATIETPEGAAWQPRQHQGKRMASSAEPPARALYACAACNSDLAGDRGWRGRDTAFWSGCGSSSSALPGRRHHDAGDNGGQTTRPALVPDGRRRCGAAPQAIGIGVDPLDALGRGGALGRRREGAARGGAGLPAPGGMPNDRPERTPRGATPAQSDRVVLPLSEPTGTPDAAPSRAIHSAKEAPVETPGKAGGGSAGLRPTA